LHESGTYVKFTLAAGRPVRVNRRKNMAARVSPVQKVQAGANGFSGVVFVLHGDDDRPIATFGFEKQEDALLGAKKMLEIIAATSVVMSGTR
jgi:hypothetical protein